MNRTRFSLLALAALAAAGAAGAKPPEGGRGGMMAARLAEMDSNKDGRITKAEAEAARMRMFDKLDADKNGIVTAAEIKTAHESMAARRPDDDKGGKGGEHGMRGIERQDVNGDGQVTREEAKAAPYPMFDRLDANKDGVIDAAEMPKGRGP
jgi:Ca2+-binding EF-hand superfamily protein